MRILGLKVKIFSKDLGNELEFYCDESIESTIKHSKFNDSCKDFGVMMSDFGDKTKFDISSILPNFTCSPNKLIREYYLQIGSSLLAIEANCPTCFNMKEATDEFRISTCYIPFQYLECYLEDLLDRTVSTKYLAISQRKLGGKVDFFALLSLLIGVIFSIYVSMASHSILTGAFLSIVFCLPILGMWSKAPFGKFSRRFTFARIVSSEIARRRGIDREGRPLTGATVFKRILGIGSRATIESAKVGTTSCRYHIH
jgi:hypothetical protein